MYPGTRGETFDEKKNLGTKISCLGPFKQHILLPIIKYIFEEDKNTSLYL
jgi:hypothetical protein